MGFNSVNLSLCLKKFSVTYFGSYKKNWKKHDFNNNISKKKVFNWCIKITTKIVCFVRIQRDVLQQIGGYFKFKLFE